MLHGKLLSVTTKAGVCQGYTGEAVAVIRDCSVICISPVVAQAGHDTRQKIS